LNSKNFLKTTIQNKYTGQTHTFEIANMNNSFGLNKINHRFNRFNGFLLDEWIVNEFRTVGSVL